MVNLVRLLIFGAVTGFGCGLVPLNLAMRRGRPGLGAGALAACVLAGMMCGGILAFPVSYFLRAFISTLPDVTDIASEVGFGWSGGPTAGPVPPPRRAGTEPDRDVIELVRADAPPTFNPYAGGRTTAF